MADAQPTWRKRMFTVALIGDALGYVWFWVVLLVSPSFHTFEAYRVIGWTSELFAAVCLALSFAGTFPARLFAVLASAGVVVLWVSVGFW